jgi:hypothetical protein
LFPLKEKSYTMCSQLNERILLKDLWTFGMSEKMMENKETFYYGN